MTSVLGTGVRRLTQEQEAFLDTLGQLLRNSGMEEIFDVGRRHHHPELGPGDVLVERPSTEPGTRIIQSGWVDKLPDSVPARWAFSNGAPQVVQVCTNCDSVPPVP